MDMLLFIVAIILANIFFPVCIIYSFVKNLFLYGIRKPFKSAAISIDIIGNLIGESLFNDILIKSEGYKFGRDGETISSVLGKNQRDNTLNKIGDGLCFILDKLDKNHCIKSIKEF